MTLICSGKYSRGRMLYLPKAAATALGITYGDTVEFHIENNEVVVRKAQVDDANTGKEK